MLKRYDNVKIASFDPKSDDDYGLIEDAQLITKNGKILWVGDLHEMPKIYEDIVPENLYGKLLTPSLIDCHTHIVYGGDRSQEFEMRLNGASYEEIARNGGGILSTLKDTRAASVDELLDQAKPRLEKMLSEGIGHLEIKSGYGLDLENELKMLEVAKIIERIYPIKVTKTLLAAHAVPAEYKDNADGYIDYIIDEILPKAVEANLVDQVDAFCENIAFTAEQVARVFEKAKSYNLDVKIHAEQLSNIGGTKMAAEFNALSSDHIEYLDDAGVKAMKDANMVAVLLPGAFYFLKETQKPPVQSLRDQGVDMALATDCNPGSSPLTSPLMCMNMGCTFFGLTPSEALKGFTLNAAKALGIDEDYGSIEIGKKACFALWDVNHPRELVYPMGLNPFLKRIYD